MRPVNRLTLVKSEFIDTLSDLDVDGRQSLLDRIDRARSLLGYAPSVDWRTGLARTLSWYRERAGR